MLTRNQDVELAQPLLEQNLPAAKNQRFHGLDLMRGFIMIVMAWDHTKDLLADTDQKGHEVWSGEAPDWRNSFSFLVARIISDICAPGFFFSMGIGITLFSISRLSRGWSYFKVIEHFGERAFVITLLERGAILGFVMQIIFAALRGYDVPMPFDPNITISREGVPRLIFSVTFLSYAVLTALGISMLCCALFLLKPMMVLNDRFVSGKSRFSAEHLGWIICFFCFALSNGVIVYYQHGDPSVAGSKFPEINGVAENPWQFIVRIFLIPGPGAGGTRFQYPIIPWAGLTALGMGFGFTAKQDYASFAKRMKPLGLISLGLFVLVRLFGGPFGNLRGFPRGDGIGVDKVNPLIEFLYTSKYPPSPAYALWTMGVNFLLIHYFSADGIDQLLESRNDVENKPWMTRMKIKALDFIHTLGTVPLFFYMTHLLLIGVIGAFFSLFLGENGIFRVEHMSLVVPFWIVVVATLYPVCQKYAVFKNQQPVESWWRML